MRSSTPRQVDLGCRIPEMPTNAESGSALKAALAQLSLAQLPLPDRGEELSPEQLLQQVKQLELIHSETGKLLHEAVLAARAAGLSWAVIGDRLGVSKQAVQRRFGTSVELARDAATERILGPVNRSNEIAILNESGRCGWKLLSSKHGEHLVLRTNTFWEVKRTLLSAPLALGKGGRERWQLASVRFPDVFFTREWHDGE